NMPATVGQGAGGSFGIGYINKAASLMLDFRLSALEKAGKGKILSQPKILTINNSPSFIRHGARVPITTPGSTQGTYTTTYIDAALLMKVTPSIVFGTSENIIYIDLEISKDEPATSSERKDMLGNPQIDSRAAATRIALKDGETVVIGGIRKEVSSEGESSVPYLSKIPILGSLFKKKDKTNVSEELMIFLTPKIVQPIKQD
ncbi:MAG: type II and III secretion system protein, partial [Thermodesulfovibrionales bacterium]|nr:type II and III secretion system protein [Thermodesulfovibrionales bacterium]